jgi:membrane protease YdiL (CAAX protease family)
VSPRLTFWTAAAVLAAFNVARALGAFGRFGDAVGLVVALAIVAVALWSGLDRPALGLAADRLRSGLAWGGAAFGLVLVVVVAAALIPATSGFLDDDRACLSFGSLAFEVIVSILLLAVIPEELAFRGVLLGAGSEAWGPRRGALASSALFGLWHIAPTLGTNGITLVVAWFALR